MLDGSEHQITNVLAADAAGGGEETHGLAILGPRGPSALVPSLNATAAHCDRRKFEREKRRNREWPAEKCR